MLLKLGANLGAISMPFLSQTMACLYDLSLQKHFPISLSIFA
jgi:hypothetical protein